MEDFEKYSFEIAVERETSIYIESVVRKLKLTMNYIIFIFFKFKINNNEYK